MSPVLTLLFSVVALGLGPAFAGIMPRQAKAHAFLDGFVLFMVAGLCLFSLLPHAYAELGPWAIAVALAGLFLPHFAESRLQGHRHGESSAILGVAVIGLFLHAALDGVALGEGHDHLHQSARGTNLALAILIHRLPVGLFLWWTMRARFGRGLTWAMLAGLSLATVAGFLVADQLPVYGPAGGILHALLAGGLLHVVIDHGPQDHGTRHRVAAASGSLVALALFALLPTADTPVVAQALRATMSLVQQSSPAIVLGFLGAGLLSLVPTEALARLMTGGNAFTSSLRGVIFGLPLPVCSCGVVPLYRSLAHKGVPPAAAMAFLVATPELGLDAILISVPLLGAKLALVRVVAAFAVALVIGVAAGLLVKSGSTPPPAPDIEVAATGSKTQRALKYGFVESVDDLGPWILAGLLFAGFLEPLIEPTFAHGIAAIAEVPLFAVLGTPLYICASGATPVAAVLLAKGVSVGAVFAFLLSGPATNVTTFGAIRSVHGRGTTIALVLAIPVASVLVGYILNGTITVDPSQAPAAQTHSQPWWRTVVAAGFLLLVAASFVRQGPRGFLRKLGIGEHTHADHAEAESCCSTDGEARGNEPDHADHVHEPV